MSVVKYLLDENVDPLYRRELLRREPSMTVMKMGDFGALPEGSLDPEILDWCQANGFLPVTNNRTSMPVHMSDHIAMGHHAEGVLILSPNLIIGQTLDILVLIRGASELEEYQNQIVHLPLRPTGTALP